MDTEEVCILKIAQRAQEVFAAIGTPRDLVDCAMDIEAAHLEEPLRLNDLLCADDFEFIHDVCGIARHLNRMTGKFEDCFLPRFTL